MKVLNSEKMSQIEGGQVLSIEMTCAIIGAAEALNNGASPGSDEFVILANLAYGACMEGHYFV